MDPLCAPICFVIRDGERCLCGEEWFRKGGKAGLRAGLNGKGELD